MENGESCHFDVQENTAELKRDVFEAAFHKRGFILSSLATHALKILFQNDLLMMTQITLSLNKYLLYTVQF